MSVHSLICRTDAERRRFIDLRQRLRVASPTVIGLYVIAGLCGVMTYGWIPLVPPFAAAAFFGLMWRRMPRLAHPESALALVWLVGELGMAGALVLVNGPIAYLIPILIMPVALAATFYPGRLMPLFAGFAIILGAGVTLAFDSAELARRPPVLLLPVGVIVVLGVALAAIRNLDIATRRSAVVDDLTGLLNRAALAPRVAELAHHVARTGARIAVIVADIDHFKAINDGSGHATGDAVLREVAERLTRCVDSDESLYRYGGEEFLVLLAGADRRTAERTAERMRRAVAATSIAGLDVTMSFGVTASVAGQPFDFEPVFARADGALYEAKLHGRNQVRVAVAATDEPGSVEHLPVRGTFVRASEEGTQVRAVRTRERRGDVDPQAPAPAPPVTAAHAGPSFIGAGTSRASEGGSWLVASTLEREHMLDLNARLRGIFIGCAIFAFALLITAVPWYGWLILPGPILGAAMYHLVQNRVEQWRRPEYALVFGWLCFQFSIAVGFFCARDSPIYGLPLFVLTVPGMGAIFPRRGVIISTAFTALLMVVVAFHLDAAAVLANPAIVAFPLALLGSSAIIGMSVGRSAVSHRNASVVDELTGLLNRTALHTRVAELGARAELTGQEVAVVIGDVDHFKQINDTHGHATGDEVLKGVAARVRGCLRTFESAYRIGGEEFAVLLSGVEAADAADVAERLRIALRSEPVNGLALTMSFGVAALRPDEHFDDDELFARADAALYRAKTTGRDRVCVAGAVPDASAALASST